MKVEDVENSKYDEFFHFSTACKNFGEVGPAKSRVNLGQNTEHSQCSLRSCKITKRLIKSLDTPVFAKQSSKKIWATANFNMPNMFEHLTNTAHWLQNILCYCPSYPSFIPNFRSREDWLALFAVSPKLTYNNYRCLMDANMQMFANILKHLLLTCRTTNNATWQQALFLQQF